MAHAQSLRIVHLVRSPIGGIFRHIADLIVAQAQVGHNVALVCDSTTGGAFENARIDTLRPSLSLGLARLPIARQISPTDICALRSVRRSLARFGPDVIHTHGAKGGAFGRVAGTRLEGSSSPVRVYSPHGGSLHYDAGSLQGRLYFRIERALERVTDAIIHVSGYEQRTYVSKIGQARCPTYVVRNGVTPPEFEPSRPANDATDFLYMGVLRDLKGVDVFIEALALLSAAGMRPTATIMGEGECEAKYRAMVSELRLGDQVRFLPSTPTRQAFSHGRAIVVPSRAESMPYIVIEAIAAGIPLVATRVGGVPEIFGPHADELVDPADPQALARAMASLNEDPRQAAAMAAARRASIMGEFSLGEMSSRIENVYRDSIENRRRRV